MNAPTNILDREMENELPGGLSIRRSFSLEPTRLIRIFKRLRKAETGLECHGDVSSTVIHSYTGLSFKALMKIKAALIPDEKIGWFPFALQAALKAMKENGIEVIFSTAPPFTTHLVALACKYLIGVPWVCEFRDPWVGYHHFKPLTPLHGWLVRRMERAMIRKADVVVCASPGIADGFIDRYPEVEKERYRVITNGFDLEDFAEEVQLETKFSITWIGSVYGGRFPGGLLQAARQLIDEGKIDCKDMKISFVGSMDQESYVFIERAGLGDIIEIVGFVEHRECIRKMRDAHLLLLQLARGEESKIIYTGKMFEYFGARRPILALVGKGATADLIDKLGAGISVNPDDVKGISEAVMHYYSLYKSTGIPAVDNTDIFELFDREKLTGKLAEVLNSIYFKQ